MRAPAVRLRGTHHRMFRARGLRRRRPTLPRHLSRRRPPRRRPPRSRPAAHPSAPPSRRPCSRKLGPPPPGRKRTRPRLPRRPQQRRLCLRCLVFSWKPLRLNLSLLATPLHCRPVRRKVVQRPRRPILWCLRILCSVVAKGWAPKHLAQPLRSELSCDRMWRNRSHPRRRRQTPECRYRRRRGQTPVLPW